MKITIHSIHSIHYIVENIDIVMVLEVHSYGYRCLKVYGFTLFLRGFPLPHPDAISPLFGKSGKIHSNVHVVFTELVLCSFPETPPPCYVYLTNVKKTLAHVILF